MLPTLHPEDIVSMKIFPGVAGFLSGGKHALMPLSESFYERVRGVFTGSGTGPS